MRAIRTLLIGVIGLALLGAGTGMVSAQEEVDPMAPAYFTFTLLSVEPTGEDPVGEEVERVDATDPRASGLLATDGNAGLVEIGEGGLIMGATSLRLVNDDGAWSGTGTVLQMLVENRGAVVLSTLTGEDAYEGLTLILVEYYDDDAQTRRGFIVPNEQVPTVPDPVEPFAD